MRTPRQLLGTRAEQDAAERLSRLPGWRLIARNVLCRMGELDLVFEHARAGTIELVFVEVRARGASDWCGALESVSWRKRSRIERAARRFLLSYRGRASAMRFDVVAFDGTDRGSRWTHVQDAWRS